MSNEEAYNNYCINYYLKKLNIDNITFNEVKYIEQSFNASTDEKIKGLYTQGLGSCVALLAFCNEFAFLAHIELGLNSRNFEQETINSEIKINYGNFIKDLLSEINKRKENISSPINIGLILGVSPVNENNIFRQRIEEGIDFVTNECERQNISVNRIPNYASILVMFDQIGQRLYLNEGEVDISEFTQNARKI